MGSGTVRRPSGGGVSSEQRSTQDTQSVDHPRGGDSIYSWFSVSGRLGRQNPDRTAAVVECRSADGRSAGTRARTTTRKPRKELSQDAP